LAYDYTTQAYSTSGHSYREVSNRYLSKNGLTQTQYTFAHDTSPTADVHAYTTLDDPGGVGQKVWYFNTTGSAEGLVSIYQGAQKVPSWDVKVENDFTWTQDAAYNSYISQVVNKSDPSHGYGVYKLTTQTVDTHGNVTASAIYDWNSTT